MYEYSQARGSRIVGSTRFTKHLFKLIKERLQSPISPSWWDRLCNNPYYSISSAKRTCVLLIQLNEDKWITFPRDTHKTIYTFGPAITIFWCFSNYKNIHAGDIVHFFWPKCKSSMRRTGQNIPSFHWSPTKSICRNIKHSKEYEDKVEKIRELKRRSIPKSNF